MLLLISHYLSTKWGGGGEGALIRGGGAYIDFQPIGGAVIRRGRLFEGGANSKIYSIQT